MKKTIVIHTDALRRDYPANWILAEKLKREGYKVLITSRLTTNRLTMLFPPDILILSHVFDYDIDVLLNVKNKGTKIFVNEVEGELEGNEVGISGTYPANVNYDIFEGIFVWAHWSKKWLNEKRLVPLSKIYAIGCTRLSFLPYISSAQKTPKIGFISRFEVFNPFDGRHSFENLVHIDPNSARGQSYLDRNNVDAECFAISMKVIQSLISEGIPVIIRPHPNEDVNSYKFLQDYFGPKLTIDHSHDYANFLNQVTHLFAPLSSAYTEPYLLKKPIVSTLGMQKNKYEVDHQQIFSMSFSRVVYEPIDIKSAVDLLKDPNTKAKQDLNFDKQISSMYSLENNDDPIDALISVINQTTSSLSNKKQVLNRLAAPFKLGMDLIYIVYCLVRKHPVMAFRTLRQYHYNVFFHKPSDFMKSILVDKK